MAERTFRRDPLSWRERTRPVFAITGAAFRADPARATASLGLRLVAAAAAPAFAAALAGVVDAAGGDQPWSAAAIAVAVLAVAVAANTILDEIGWKIVQVLEERTSHKVDLDIQTIVTGLPRLDHYERPENLDKIERIKEEQWLLGMSVEALVNAAVVTFQVGLTVLLLVSVDLRLLVLPLLAIPSMLAGAKAERIRWKVLDENVGDYRRVGDLMKLATEVQPAKEMRIFGLGPEILRRHREVTERMEGWERRHRLQGAALTAAGRAVFALGYVWAIWIVAVPVVTGGRPVGDLVLTVVLAGQVMAQLQGATGTANWTAWTFTAVRRWLWLLDFAADANDRGGRLPAPSALTSGVRFESVSFRYPGTDVDVLRDVSLELPAGSVVALVGDNGAGKTTLVKLLARFYEPSSGRITVDGVPLADVDIESWRTHTAAVFQDHARLELHARSAVTLGDPGRLDDDERAVEALHRAGAADVLAALPDGLGTQLGARWPGGVDLSGGQWQKLALGRGMMRSGPVLLLLDEPTAALDADAEHRLFQTYAEDAARGAAERGAITVLVSHRFSTVRMADSIIVVGDGHIVEHGSHDELMASGGTYAELYRLQARAYR